jgi:hypothetical protein
MSKQFRPISDKINASHAFKECMVNKSCVYRHFDRANQARKYFEEQIDDIDNLADGFRVDYDELKDVPLTTILEILERGREIGFQQGFDAASGDLPF